MTWTERTGGSHGGRPGSRLPRRLRRHLPLLVLCVAATIAGACGGDNDTAYRKAVRFDGGPPVAVPGRPAGLSPVSVVVQGDTVWAADPGAGQVVEVDAGSAAVRRVVPLEGFPSLVAASEAQVWAATRLSGWVVPLETTGATVDAGGTDPASPGGEPPGVISSGGDFPEALAAGPTADSPVWVTNFAGRSLGRVDPGQPPDTAAVTVDLGFRPSGVAVVDGAPWVAGITHGAVVRLDANGTPIGETPVRGGPEWLAAGSDSVFVTARLAGRLERLDARSGELTGGVDLGFRPGAVAVAPTGAWPGGAGEVVWVADPAGGAVAGVDPSTLEVVVAFDVGGVPMALAPSGDTVWVADAGRSALVAITTATGAARVVPMPAPGAGSGSGGASSPEVVTSVSGVLPVVDPHRQAAGSVPVRVPVDFDPFYVVADGGGVWVADADADGSGQSQVAVIDPGTLGVRAAATLEGVLGGLAVGPSGTQVWVSEFERRRVVRLGTAMPGAGPDLVVEVGSDPLGVLATAGSVWVALRGDGRVVRLEERSGAEQADIEVGEGPANIAVDPGTGNLWVTLADANALAEIDPDANAVVRVVPVGNTPVGVAVGAGSVWVTTRDDGALVVVDPDTGAIRERILVGNRPRGVAVTNGGGPDGGDRPATVWVAVSGDGTLVRLDAATRRVEGLVPVGVFPINLAAAAGAGEVDVWVTDLDGRVLLGVSRAG